MKAAAIAVLSLSVAAPALAHVTVAPQQASASASQIYKVRVHNDGKGPTSSIQVQIPEGVAIDSVAPVDGATSEMVKTGNRVSAIRWDIAVPVGKYVELPFTAKNPAAPTQLSWNIIEKFKDGSTIDYTDQPGAKEKASITKIIKPTP